MRILIVTTFMYLLHADIALTNVDSNMHEKEQEPQVLENSSYTFVSFISILQRLILCFTTSEQNITSLANPVLVC